jgi:hypothetical protein
MSYTDPAGKSKAQRRREARAKFDRDVATGEVKIRKMTDEEKAEARAARERCRAELSPAVVRRADRTRAKNHTYAKSLDYLDRKKAAQNA